jgi:5-methylcytosine-specific restriction endonuclease McrA
MAVSRKAVPKDITQYLLSKQKTKCANTLDNPAIGLKDYICPLWLLYGGQFDESGYERDHIIEVCQGGSNDIDNIQLLCPSCHSVKTKRFIKQSKPCGYSRINSKDLHNGVAYMEFDNNKDQSKSKKRKTNKIDKME